MVLVGCCYLLLGSQCLLIFPGGLWWVAVISCALWMVAVLPPFLTRFTGCNKLTILRATHHSHTRMAAGIHDNLSSVRVR